MNPFDALTTLALEAEQSPQADRLVVLDAIAALAGWCSRRSDPKSESDMRSGAFHIGATAASIADLLRTAERQQFEFTQLLTGDAPNPQSAIRNPQSEI